MGYGFGLDIDAIRIFMGQIMNVTIAQRLNQIEINDKYGVIKTTKLNTPRKSDSRTHFDT